MKKIELILMSAFVLAFSCNKPEEDVVTPPAPTTVSVQSVTLDKTSLDLVEGDEATLVATVNPDNATDKTVTWSTSDASIATVDNGKVTAVKEGTATITAKAGEKSASCTVTVAKKVIAVESVTLDKTSLDLVEGDEATLVATVNPDNATDKTVTWSITDAAIATVDNGKVTAIKEGTATITAKAGEKSATCTVTVAKKVIAVESVTLDKTSLDLVEGDEATLVATVNPDNATDKTVTWSITDAAIATVDNGKVTAVKEGTATISVTAQNGLKATCSVTVTKAAVPATGVSLDKSSMELFINETGWLFATLTPSNSTDQVSWSSDNPSIATVSETGKVTAVAEGTAVITAQVGEMHASCTVTVKKKIAVESLELNKTALALVKGESETLLASVSPDNATDKTVTWSSSHANVASVTKDGKVTAVGGGEAVITAKAGTLSATCTVTVTVPVESVSLDKSTLSLKKGETFTLKATVNPSDATDKALTWSSSNPDIASVSSSGVVSAQAKGEVTITVSISGKTATCKVTVTEQNTEDYGSGEGQWE